MRGTESQKGSWRLFFIVLVSLVSGELFFGAVWL